MNMKKAIAVCLLAGIPLITLSGCAGSNNTDSGTATQQHSAENSAASSAGTAQNTQEDDTQPAAQDDAWKQNTGTINLNAMTVSGDGVQVDGKVITITKGGDFTVTGTLTDGNIFVNTIEDEKVKLRLKNASITSSDGPAINCEKAKKLFITLEEGTKNVLKDAAIHSQEGTKAALFSNDTLEIKGGGALEVTGNYKHAVASDDDIIIENGTITTSSVKDGFHANDDITVNGGTIIVKNGYDGLQSEGTLTVNGGSITTDTDDDGIAAELELVINGGDIKISNGYEGIESKTSITINGGTVEAAVEDDGLNAANGIVMNDGTVYCASLKGDAVDCNGTITLNGGTLVAIGAQEPEGGVDCDNNTFAINGGVMVATGGTNSQPSGTSKQCSVSLAGAQANTAMYITNGAQTVLSFVLPKTASSMLVSSSGLESGKSYTVYTGGSISGGTEFYGLYTGATAFGGTQAAAFTTDSVFTNAGGGTGMGGGPGGGMGGGGNMGGMPMW